MKVLDVGCGVGGPMRSIARFSRRHDRRCEQQRLPAREGAQPQREGRPRQPLLRLQRRLHEAWASPIGPTMRRTRSRRPATRRTRPARSRRSIASSSRRPVRRLRMVHDRQVRPERRSPPRDQERDRDRRQSPGHRQHSRNDSGAREGWLRSDRQLRRGRHGATRKPRGTSRCWANPLASWGFVAGGSAGALPGARLAALKRLASHPRAPRKSAKCSAEPPRPSSPEASRGSSRRATSSSHDERPSGALRGSRGSVRTRSDLPAALPGGVVCRGARHRCARPAAYRCASRETTWCCSGTAAVKSAPSVPTARTWVRISRTAWCETAASSAPFTDGGSMEKVASRTCPSGQRPEPRHRTVSWAVVELHGWVCVYPPAW